MRLLFVHQSFPAQYLHMVMALRNGGHEVVFICRATTRQIPGVRVVPYEIDSELPRGIPPATALYELALRRAEGVARQAALLKAEGFTPDVMIGHHGWGETLSLQDVWDNVPVLGYYEYYHHAKGFAADFDPLTGGSAGYEPLVRARNIPNIAALALPGWGQTPTRFQLSTYPKMYQDRIFLIPEGVDLRVCRPDSEARLRPMALAGLAATPEIAAAQQDQMIAPSDLVVTYANRHLEPARGMQAMMFALPRLLANPRVRVIVLGNETSGGYGASIEGRSWKDFFLSAVKGKYDESRVHFLGQVAHEHHISVLRRSDCHVYLTSPFVVSWSLREALACGCAIVASDTAPVREFIEDGRNGVLTSYFYHNVLAAKVLEVLENPELGAKLRANARAYAEEHFDLKRTLGRFASVINWLAGRGDRPEMHSD